MKDPWHFERRDFTAHVLSLLTEGPAGALSLFGPRRTGKTEFLLKDLAPRAQRRGHRVIYASFWQSPLSPLAVLLDALETRPSASPFVAPSPPLREPAPTAGRVQAALRRLQRLGIADTHTGAWSLVDPEFTAWTRDQARRG